MSVFLHQMFSTLMTLNTSIFLSSERKMWQWKPGLTSAEQIMRFISKIYVFMLALRSSKKEGLWLENKNEKKFSWKRDIIMLQNDSFLCCINWSV